MNYSDGYLSEALPFYGPPASLVPPEVERAIAQENESSGLDDEDLLHRSRRWTYALFSEMRLGQWVFRPRINGAVSWGLTTAFNNPFERCAIGLMDPEHEAPGFGLVLTSQVPMERPFELVGDAFFPRLEQTFPVGLGSARIELHALAHPAGATSACWARSRKTALWGVLTAGHAVRHVGRGGPVAMSLGPQGQLGRARYPPIDAAFVLTTPPSGPVSPLPVAPLPCPAAGFRVWVDSQKVPLQRRVIRTLDTLGVVRTGAFPVLSFLDLPCVPGDSGALVSDVNRQALGLYLGSMNTTQVSGGVVGLVQNLEQVMHVLKVDPFI